MLTIIEVTIEYINEKKHNTENVIYNVSNYNAFYIYIIKKYAIINYKFLKIFVKTIAYFTKYLYN